MAGNTRPLSLACASQRLKASVSLARQSLRCPIDVGSTTERTCFQPITVERWMASQTGTQFGRNGKVVAGRAGDTSRGRLRFLWQEFRFRKLEIRGACPLETGREDIREFCPKRAAQPTVLCNTGLMAAVTRSEPWSLRRIATQSQEDSLTCRTTRPTTRPFGIARLS